MASDNSARKTFPESGNGPGRLTSRIRSVVRPTKITCGKIKRYDNAECRA
jgi:hypothetical protein